MDTTSNTLSRILQLLAEHPDTQEKLRQELLHAGAADGLSYDELNRLPLLDSICHETLRVYVTFYPLAVVLITELPQIPTGDHSRQKVSLDPALPRA